MPEKPSREAQSSPTDDSSTRADGKSPQQLTFGPAATSPERPFVSICIETAVPHALKLAWIALASKCRVWVGESRVGHVEMSIGRIAALCDVTYRRAQQMVDGLLDLACLHRETVGTGRRRSTYALMPDALEKVPSTIPQRRRRTSETASRDAIHYVPGTKCTSSLGRNPLRDVRGSSGGSWEGSTQAAAADPSLGDRPQPGAEAPSSSKRNPRLLRLTDDQTPGRKRAGVRCRRRTTGLTGASRG